MFSVVFLFNLFIRNTVEVVADEIPTNYRCLFDWRDRNNPNINCAKSQTKSAYCTLKVLAVCFPLSVNMELHQVKSFIFRISIEPRKSHHIFNLSFFSSQECCLSDYYDIDL